jgi:hypothetical protein
MGPKLFRYSLLLFLLGGFKRVVGQTAEDSMLIRRLADVILADGKAYGDLKVLTKEIGPRLSGSIGYYKAEKWGQDALRNAQADKVYLQACMAPHWVRGGKDEASTPYLGFTEWVPRRRVKLDVLAAFYRNISCLRRCGTVLRAGPEYGGKIWRRGCDRADDGRRGRQQPAHGFACL